MPSNRLGSRRGDEAIESKVAACHSKSSNHTVMIKPDISVLSPRLNCRGAWRGATESKYLVERYSAFKWEPRTPTGHENIFLQIMRTQRGVQPQELNPQLIGIYSRIY